MTQAILESDPRYAVAMGQIIITMLITVLFTAEQHNNCKFTKQGTLF